METQRNPQHGTFKLPEEYKDLGWQLHEDNNMEIAICAKVKHHAHNWRKFDNSLYLHRCTDIITICDECKIFWHTDMSD